jgi:hypothetical protein
VEGYQEWPVSGQLRSYMLSEYSISLTGKNRPKSDHQLTSRNVLQV